MTALAVCSVLALLAAGEAAWLLWSTRDRRPKGVFERYVYDLGQSMRWLELHIVEALSPAVASLAAWLNDNKDVIGLFAAELHADEGTTDT